MDVSKIRSEYRENRAANGDGLRGVGVKDLEAIRDAAPIAPAEDVKALHDEISELEYENHSMHDTLDIADLRITEMAKAIECHRRYGKRWQVP